MHENMNTNIYIYTNMYIYMYVSIYVYTNIYTYTFTHVNISIHTAPPRPVLVAPTPHRSDHHLPVCVVLCRACSGDVDEYVGLNELNRESCQTPIVLCERVWHKRNFRARNTAMKCRDRCKKRKTRAYTKILRVNRRTTLTKEKKTVSGAKKELA